MSHSPEGLNPASTQASSSPLSNEGQGLAATPQSLRQSWKTWWAHEAMALQPSRDGSEGPVEHLCAGVHRSQLQLPGWHLVLHPMLHSNLDPWVFSLVFLNFFFLCHPFLSYAKLSWIHKIMSSLDSCGCSVIDLAEKFRSRKWYTIYKNYIRIAVIAVPFFPCYFLLAKI